MTFRSDPTVATPTPVRASESGHWYWPSGLPAYEMETANGYRPTTLRDARKLGLLPSVTTIIKAAASPGLEIWKQRQVLMAALTLPRQTGETDEALINRILSDSKEETRQAADRGTEIHAAVQAYFGEMETPPAHLDTVQAVAHELRGWFGDLAWPMDAERCFAHPLGFGGKTDLSTPLLILDVKTKAFEDAKEVNVYDEQVMQLAAYRVGLGHPYARCANVFVSTTKPGLIWVKEHEAGDLAKAWEMFVALLHFWRHKTGHYPKAA